MKSISQLIEKLILLFTRGGKLKNGTSVVKNLSYTSQLKAITNWERTNTQVFKLWMRLPKDQQILYLRQIRQGKLTTQQLEKQLQKNIPGSIRGLINKLKVRAVTPIGYNLTKPFGIPLEILLPKIGPRYQSLKNRYDAWNIYNNVSQKYNSMLRLGTHTDGRAVYTIKNFTVAKSDIDAIIQNPKQSGIGTSFNFAGVHGNGAAYKGVDSKGKYIVFYDLWDLQPLKGVVNRLGSKLKLPKDQMNKIANFEVGGNPFWTKNKVYYDDAGNIFRADGKTQLYSTKGPMYRDITGAPDQSLLNVKNAKKRKAALDRLGKKQVTVYSTEPITPETLGAMLGEWGAHIKYSKIKSTIPIIIATGTVAYIGLDALVSYITDKNENERKKIGNYMVKNKLSQKNLNDKLVNKQFKFALNTKLGFTK